MSTAENKAVRIMEALSGTDEALLARCEDAGKGGTVRKVIPFRRYSRAAAVCFALVALGTLCYGTYAFVTWDKADNSESLLAGLEGSSYMENAAADTAVPQMSDGDTGAAGGNGAGTMNGDAEPGIPAAQPTEYEMERPEDKLQQQMSGEEENRTTDGIADAKEESKEVLSSVKGSDLLIDNTEDAAGDSANSMTPDIESCGVPRDERPLLTLEEAQKTETVGAFIPTVLPKGYVLESIYGRSPDTSVQELSLSWTKGMDYVSLYITDYYAIAKGPAWEELNNRIVDISKPETYDVRLYEIPYGQTVPEQYRSIFDNPVFREEDFTIELVEARMKTVEDSGDTSTPRGNFSVLYEDGVLVRFTGKATAAQVWDMFSSIQQ